jgi:hypothetical protein
MCLYACVCVCVCVCICFEFHKQLVSNLLIDKIPKGVGGPTRCPRGANRGGTGMVFFLYVFVFVFVCVCLCVCVCVCVCLCVS